MPRSSRTGIEGERDGALLVRLSAPPVDDAANEQLVELLARTLKIPKSHVHIVGGVHGRRKRVLTRGLTAAQLRERLEAVLASPD